MIEVTPAAAAIGLGATPLAIDERGIPRLLRGGPLMPAMPATDATTSARAQVTRLAPAWGVQTAAVPALVSIGEIAQPGGTIVRLRQFIDGLPVDTDAGGELRVMVANDGSLVAASGAMIATTTPHSASTSAALDDAGAVARAVSVHFNNAVFAPTTLAIAATAADGSRMLAGQASAINVSLSRARQAWVPEHKSLTKVWVVEAYAGPATSSTSDAFRTVIAAADGRVLSETNLTQDVAFNYRVFAETTGERHPFDGAVADVTPNAAGVPNSVFYPPFVSPNMVSIEGLNHPRGATTPDPWLSSGRTETIGNNVEAYTDINAPDGLTFGDYRATITSAGTFDRSYDPTLSATASQAQQMAAITSLFYLNNWLHDQWYDAGFTEAAGNAQNSNLGRGGEDRDALLAEAQDNANGGSRNNANMSTPQDGFPPRMQVFVWDGRDNRSLGTSGAVTRKPVTGSSAFGNKHFETAAPLVLANDGTGVVTDACEPFAAPVTGQIVLADRGTCTFKTKALNVQSAGGVALIIANNAASLFAPGMADDATITTAITIGVVSVLQSDGVLLKADLAAGPVTATVHRNVAPDLDGSLDATVISHENGHYVHHRLTSCNTALCGAQSEGWGDFAALLTMVRAGDNFNAAFQMGVYSTASFNDPTYYGIRRAPYSTNKAINGLSFRHMASGNALPPPPFNGGDPAGNSEVHNGGEVWASMMWEGYSALLQQPGAQFEATRLKMRQYVVSGLLLAPTDATPTETRDSILAAAHAASPADHDVLAAAYARRGFGSCAISPPRTSTSFVGIVENFEVKGRVAAGAPTLQVVSSCDHDEVLDGGETARITVPISNPGPAAIADVAVALSSTTPGIHITNPAATVGSLAAYGTTNVTFNVRLDDTVTTAVAGDFSLHLTTSNGCNTALDIPVAIRLNTDDLPANSATETFDAGSTVWTSTGSEPLWLHNRPTPLNGLFVGVDAGEPSDASLTSPALTAGSGPVTLELTQRFSFDASAAQAFDGGVIEYSTDGVTWLDISTIANPGYNTTLTGDPAGTGNPLSGRPAFGRSSTGYPAMSKVTLSLGTALAGQTFRLRFRVGSDVDTGAPGWEIDNLAFTGIVGKPFPTLIADTGSCTVAPPLDAGMADAGIHAGPDAGKVVQTPGEGGQDPNTSAGCQVGGSGAGAGAALGLLAVLLRRRRR